MTPRWPALLLCLPAVAGCRPVGDAPVEHRETACAAAVEGAAGLVAMARLSGAYREADQRLAPEALEDLTETEWRPWEAAPPHALLATYAATPPASALTACPSVPIALERAGLDRGPAEEGEGRAAGARPLILDVPVLNPAGDEALMRVAVLPARSGEGGVSGVSWLRRDERGWRVVETKVTAIFD